MELPVSLYWTLTKSNTMISLRLREAQGQDSDCSLPTGTTLRAWEIYIC